MWLARLLGGRRDDSEPSQFPPHPAANADSKPRPVAVGAAAGSKAQHEAVLKAKGFDPYNSGAFRRASAWERIGRR